MTRTSRATKVLLACMGVALLSGCGSSGSSAPSAHGNGDSGRRSDTAATSAQGTGSDTGSDAGAGGCEETTLTGTVGGKPFKPTSAVGVSLDGGKGYTVYLADFPIELSDLSRYANPDVPDGKTMVMLFDTVLNAKDPAKVALVAVGDHVEWTDEFGVRTFLVTAEGSGEQYQSNMGGKGTLDVTAVGKRFCGTVEYSDDEKQVSGTFAADVKAL